jgi:hypothetical protein
MKLFYFRCKTGGKHAPLLKLTAGEAREMENHPDYERVDEFGEVVETTDDMEGTIPFQGSGGRK